jgi:plasmid stabilization system protein ParE
VTRGYVLSDHATEDLREIWRYVFDFEKSEQRADDAVDRVFRTLDLLAERPGMGRTRKWLKPEHLAFPCGTYTIVYRVAGNEIEVARVTGADEDLKRNH